MEAKTHIVCLTRGHRFLGAHEILRESNSHYYTASFRVHKRTCKAVALAGAALPAHYYELATAAQARTLAEEARVLSDYVRALDLIAVAGDRARSPKPEA